MQLQLDSSGLHLYSLLKHKNGGQLQRFGKTPADLVCQAALNPFVQLHKGPLGVIRVHVVTGGLLHTLDYRGCCAQRLLDQFWQQVAEDFRLQGLESAQLHGCVPCEALLKGMHAC